MEKNSRTNIQVKNVAEKMDTFIYLRTKNIIYINPNSRSCFARVAFVRHFRYFCKKIKIDKIFIIKNDKNVKTITWLTNEIENKTVNVGSKQSESRDK